MKLLNVVLREILVFLEFKDIVNSGLAFVSKKFYHNIVEDNEVLRRMIPRYVAIIRDYDREVRYHNMISSMVRDQNSEYQDRQLKNFSKFYDSCESKLWNILRVLESDVSQEFTVELARISGVRHRFNENIRLKKIFNNLEGIYYSQREDYLKNQIFCATGIIKPFQIDIFNGQVAIKSEDTDMNESIESSGSENSSSDPENSDEFEAKCELAVPSSELFDELKIAEFEKSSLESIPFWNGFKVLFSNYATTPIKTIAIFVHDYPMTVEDHPLAHIVKEKFLDAVMGNKLKILPSKTLMIAYQY
ncbi:unnamed protein product [Moneuplotes crassus]|uniref:F-box domain-containing protein n=1 Tax=Euplotes crassus TaxID=5936 RepID=A0AAD1U653_EUPCR|nr:unnamed protein product [Moneuplotes crassus]